MKGINVSKHRQLKKVLHEVEQTLSSQQSAVGSTAIQDCTENLDRLFLEYQRQLTELEHLIDQYEACAHQARMQFFAKPFRKLLRDEPIQELDLQRLVQAINALAK